MDKKRQMVFNLNNFLLAFSEVFNSKKVAYISLNLGIKFGFDNKKLADLCSCALIFCLERNSLKEFDFLDSSHLEDKTFKEIINFSTLICENFDFSKNSINQRIDTLDFVKNNQENFSKELIENFFEISKYLTFWLNLENESEIIIFIYSNLEDFTKALDFEDIFKMTKVFHKLQNPKSNILDSALKVTDFFEFEHKDKQIFLIATSLQNIGKLYISKDILDKKEPLNLEEKEIIKQYPYYTKKVINSIMGFSDISSLSFKAQERLDGSGIFNLFSKDLSFKDRLIICLIIYSALREQKAYREAFSHKKAIEIMKDMANNKKIDESIVDIFDKILA
ncbi:HD-GYP domain-containing protein [Aliarcobacter cryaerophilus]|uniref:HD-GYP domain-containing protein n=1 Tax=Aliarcobacter cryaerophilus TaxID=28198 RepID=UPI0011E00491|nr:HD domain-containing phosphohydrolase [Aliarcobacter cryaerophilus]